jgi:hypothetical protein
LTWFERNTGKLQTFAWPFQEMEFFLLKTTEKLPTHEHLNSLSEFNFEPMQVPMQMLRQGLSDVNWDLFLAGLRDFRGQIQANAWLSHASAKLIHKLESNPEIIFAKGCGAMGADVLFILFQKKDILPVKKIVADLGLKVRGSSQNLSSGIQVMSASTRANEAIL